MLDPKDFPKVLFPAQAGVIHETVSAMQGVKAFPRTGGGDPYRRFKHIRARDFSPHRRG